VRGADPAAEATDMAGASPGATAGDGDVCSAIRGSGGVSVKAKLRRQIHVGDRVVTGTVCEECTIPIVIYPKAAMAAHVALHDAAALGPNRLMPQPAPRYRHGRPPRSKYDAR